MIRYLIVSVCLVLAAFPAMKAAPIDGIRVESPHRKIVVRADGRHKRVMSASAFEQFMELMGKQRFDSDRKEVLDHALLTSWFTTDQCIRLMELYRFDSEKKQLMKKMYPKIADKPNFYYAIDKLTFSSDKSEVNAFIKQYHEKNN